MEASVAITLIDLALRVWPKVQERIAAGEVSKEEQAQLLAKYNELASNLDQHFSGPEWEVNPKI